MMTNIAGCALALLLAGQAGAAEVGNIDKLTFRGDAARLALKTDSSKPYQLSLDKRNWSDTACKVSTSRQGGELIFNVDLGKKLASRCELTVRGNVRPGKTLNIELKAAEGDIDGQFAAILADSQALTLRFTGSSKLLMLEGSALKGNINASLEQLSLKGQSLKLVFKGSSQKVYLEGQAVKAEMAFKDAQPKSDIQAQAQALQLVLSAPAAAKVDYQVNGVASKASSDWVNTPGAPWKVRASGQAVKLALEHD